MKPSVKSTKSVKSAKSTKSVKSNGIWGVMYSAESRGHLITLMDNPRTFGRASIEQLLSVKIDKPVGWLKNQRIFTITLNPVNGNEDELEILIKSNLNKGINVNGELVTDEVHIRTGKCVISLEQFYGDLIFEAFCDVDHNKDLVNIGENYRYISIFGKGGYATVYRAFDLKKEEFCAIKVEVKSAARRTLHKEYDFIKDLRHVNIIKCLAFIESVDVDVRYLVTEVCDGGNLLYRINQDRGVGEEMAKFLFTQVFNGVKYLHDQEIIHGDIKPENIVLTSAEDFCLVKLIDFGACCRFSDIRTIGQMVGTMSYMAPEILPIHRDSRPKFDKKIDVWSLGASLFCTLTRTKPFPPKRSAVEFRQSILDNQVNTETEIYSQLSERAKAILARCMQVEQDDRPVIEDLMIDEWFQPEPEVVEPEVIEGEGETEMVNV